MDQASHFIHCLNTNESFIVRMFDRFRARKPWMAVYFASGAKPFLTFGDNEVDFVRPILALSGKEYDFCHAFDSSKPIEPQLTQLKASLAA